MKNRYSSFEFWDGFVLGMTIGMIVTFLIVWLFDSSVSQAIQDKIINLTAIIASLVVAIFAMYGIRLQIQFQKNLEAERIRADLEAERAVLPLALLRMCEISQRGMQEAVGPNHVTPDTLENSDMALETTHLKSIKDTIKLTDGPIRERLQAILRLYQTAFARHRSMQQGSLNKDKLNDDRSMMVAYRWAVLWTLSEGLFEFARRGGSYNSSTSFPVQDKVSQAFASAGLLPQHFKGFEEFINGEVDKDSTGHISDMD